MKKFIIALCVLCSGLSYGQITLEKSLNGYIMHPTASNLPIYGDVDYYCEVISYDTRIDLYNQDFSLYKTISLDLDVPFVSSSYFTRTLFNDDDKIEFLANCNGKLFLCNEDGKVLKDFGGEGVSTSSVHQLRDGRLRLTVLRSIMKNGGYDYTTDIYSLPGTFNTKVEQANQSSAFAAPYPNPASTVINLPYTLQQGETATMQIFNPQGKLVEEKQVGSMFDEILLDVSAYAKGTYVYTVNGVSNRFIVQ